MAVQTYTATCHTPGCENAGIALEMAYDDEMGPPDTVGCGPCGQPITDLDGLPEVEHRT